MKNSQENNAKVTALKAISSSNWNGSTIHDNLDKCLAALNLSTTNSGWYKPSAVQINGLEGVYMVNQDGSLFCEARIVQEGEKKFKIEYMTMSGWNQFENFMNQILD